MSTHYQCQSTYVIASGPWGSDFVECQKPADHKKHPEHVFAYPRNGGVVRWADDTVTAEKKPDLSGHIHDWKYDRKYHGSRCACGAWDGDDLC